MLSLQSPNGSFRRKVSAAALAAVILSGIVLNGSIVALYGPGSSEIVTTAYAAASSAVRPLPSKKVVVAKAAAPSILKVVDQSDILPRHRKLADKVLRALPSKCRDSLASFYVTYDKKAANRGLGGESVIIVSGTVSDQEFMALVVHECGHVVDIGGLRGTLSGDRTSFYDGNTPIYGDDLSLAFYQISWITPTINQPGSTDADFVSGYAMTDPFEDFAETFAYYALQPKEFKRIAAKNPVLKAKYDFMVNVVFAGDQPVAVGKYTRGRSAPWDVTKLPYVWIAKA